MRIPPTIARRRSMRALLLAALLCGPAVAACEGSAPTEEAPPTLLPLSVTASAVRADSAVIAGRIPADGRAVFSGVGASVAALPAAVAGLPSLEPTSPLFAVDADGYFIAPDRMRYRFSWRAGSGWVYGPLAVAVPRSIESSLHRVGVAGAPGDSIGTISLHDSTNAGSTRLAARWFTDRDSAQGDLRTIGAVGNTGTGLRLRSVVGRWPQYSVSADEEMTSDATGSRGFTSFQSTLEPVNGVTYNVVWTVTRSSSRIAVNVVVARRAPSVPITTFIADLTDNSPGTAGGDTTRISIDGRALGFFANGGGSLQQSTHPDGAEVAAAHFGLVAAMLPPGGGLLLVSEQLAKVRSAIRLSP